MNKELKEKVKTLAREEMLEIIKNDLNSSIIYIYIKSLEDKISKTIDYLKTFHFIDNIRVLDVKEYKELLEILGDKENENNNN